MGILLVHLVNLLFFMLVRFLRLYDDIRARRRDVLLIFKLKLIDLIVFHPSLKYLNAKRS